MARLTLLGGVAGPGTAKLVVALAVGLGIQGVVAELALLIKVEIGGERAPDGAAAGLGVVFGQFYVAA